MYHKIALKANLFRSNPELKKKTQKDKWFDKKCEIMRKKTPKPSPTTQPKDQRKVLQKS